jgi:hypothetical protein
MGRKQTEATKQKIKDSWHATHPPISDETREKMSLAQKGKKRSEEFCRKNGERTKGKKYSLGYKHTDEHKKRMSLLFTGRKMDEEAKEKLRNAWESGRAKRIGTNAPRWKGGITPKNTLIRNSIDYEHWRNSVFTRDDWTCQICGQRGGDLHAHHIKPFAVFFELRLDINNGITYCRRCHRMVHTGTKYDNYVIKPLPDITAHRSAGWMVA